MVVVVHHHPSVGDTVHLRHVARETFQVGVSLRAQLALVNLFPPPCKSQHCFATCNTALCISPVGVKGAMLTPLGDMEDPGGPVLGCLVFLCMYRLM